MKTILVVEDSAFVRIATERMLVKEGYHVLSAGDGEEALSMARKNEPADLIVLDMLLPKLSGPEVLRALKLDARTTQIPVVVLSSLSQINEGKLIEDGAAVFVNKASLIKNPSSLLEAIQALKLSALSKS